MISTNSLMRYQGKAFMRNSHCLYLPPHPLLRPCIANYTISLPSVDTMPDAYTVLPTASSTMVISVSGSRIISRLRGVNTRATVVGAHANKMKLLLLIEFHPGGLHPFLPVDQIELQDASFALDGLDATLMQELEAELERTDDVEVLVAALNRLFLERLMKAHGAHDEGIAAMVRSMVAQRGCGSVGEVASAFAYSEKQLRRLFVRQVGTCPKLFARIVRANHALHLLQKQPATLTKVAIDAGFYDQAHFIHDFQSICGLTPQEYRRRMSVFYNDGYKM